MIKSVPGSLDARRVANLTAAQPPREPSVATTILIGPPSLGPRRRLWAELAFIRSLVAAPTSGAMIRSHHARVGRHPANGANGGSAGPGRHGRCDSRGR